MATSKAPSTKVRRSRCGQRLAKDGPSTKKLLQNFELVALCGAHIGLSMSAPLLLDWVQRRQYRLTGVARYPFSVSSLSFHTYFCAALIGVFLSFAKGSKAGLASLNRPHMVARFALVASLLATGDMLSVASMRHLDAGTFTLIGKAFSVGVTAGLSYLWLGKKQTLRQVAIIAGLVVATFTFCYGGDGGGAGVSGSGSFLLGLACRSSGMVLASLSNVMQERLMKQEKGVSFVTQQCWVCVGGMLMSLVALHFQRGVSFESLFEGFDTWPTFLAISLNLCHVVIASLLVKRQGALTKSLCIPFVLAGCYTYGVMIGSTQPELVSVASLMTSSSLLVAFAMSKAENEDVKLAGKMAPVLPKFVKVAVHAAEVQCVQC